MAGRDTRKAGLERCTELPQVGGPLDCKPTWEREPLFLLRGRSECCPQVQGPTELPPVHLSVSACRERICPTSRPPSRSQNGLGARRWDLRSHRIFVFKWQKLSGLAAAQFTLLEVTP